MKRRMPYWFRRYIVHDIWRKLIALTLAVLCWGWLRYQISGKGDVRYQIVVDYNAKTYFVKESDRVQNVTLKTSVNDDGTSVLERIARGKHSSSDADILHVKLNASKINGRDSGNAQFSMYDISAPTGTIIWQMKPEHFIVPFDRVITKEVPVRLPETIPCGTYMLSFVSAEPSVVTMRGPSQYLKDISEVSIVVPQYVNELKRGDMAQAEGGVESSGLDWSNGCEMNVKQYYPGIVSCSHGKVKVKMEKTDIGVKVSREEYRRLEVLFVPDGLECALDEEKLVFLELKGDSKAMRSLDAKQLFVYVNLNGIQQDGDVELPVQVAGIPHGIRCESLVPKTVKLTVRRHEGKSGAETGDAAP